MRFRAYGVLGFRASGVSRYHPSHRGVWTYGGLCCLKLSSSLGLGSWALEICSVATWLMQDGVTYTVRLNTQREPASPDINMMQKPDDQTDEPDAEGPDMVKCPKIYIRLDGLPPNFSWSRVIKVPLMLCITSKQADLSPALKKQRRDTPGETDSQQEVEGKADRREDTTACVRCADTQRGPKAARYLVVNGTEPQFNAR